MMIFLLKTLALAVISFSALAEVDLACKSDCLNRYSNDYCEQRCSYSSGNPSGSSGYKPNGALDALFQGRQQAEREARSQQELVLQALAIRAEIERQKQAQEGREQTSPSAVNSQSASDKFAYAVREFENGQLNYKGQKYDDALMHFVRSADAGYSNGQYAVGFMYSAGQGISANPVEAYKWKKRAAEQGLSVAQDDVGLALLNGLGVSKDPIEAVKWFRKAAEQGMPDAQYNLASCYGTGRGVELDHLLALRWHKAAAEGGHVIAQRGLGLSYLYGTAVVAKSEADAVMWLKKAAQQGDKRAQETLVKLDKKQ